MSDWIDSGRGTTVRYDDVSTVHHGCEEVEQEHIKLDTWGKPKSIVILRNGEYIRAYISAKIVRQRLRETESARQPPPPTDKMLALEILADTVRGYLQGLETGDTSTTELESALAQVDAAYAVEPEQRG